MRIIKAIEFATNEHDGQVRKSDGMPYIGHPMAVMALVQSVGGDEVTQIAALLHDVVEDTDTTFEEIEELFGTQVRGVVREVTEVGSEGAVKASWEDRKQASIDALHYKSYRGLLVTAADKLHNVMGLVEQLEIQGDALWDKFSRGKAKQLWVYGTQAKKLKECAENRFNHETGLEILADLLIEEVAKLS